MSDWCGECGAASEWRAYRAASLAGVHTVLQERHTVLPLGVVHTVLQGRHTVLRQVKRDQQDDWQCTAPVSLPNITLSSVDASTTRRCSLPSLCWPRCTALCAHCTAIYSHCTALYPHSFSLRVCTLACTKVDPNRLLSIRLLTIRLLTIRLLSGSSQTLTTRVSWVMCSMSSH